MLYNMGIRIFIAHMHTATKAKRRSAAVLSPKISIAQLLRITGSPTGMEGVMVTAA